MVDAAQFAYWSRDWERYWAIRDHLRKYSDDPRTEDILTQRIFPKKLYVCKDFVDNVIHRFHNVLSQAKTP
jgi:hypothetical protein